MGNTYILYDQPISYLSGKSGECAKISVAWHLYKHTHTHTWTFKPEDQNRNAFVEHVLLSSREIQLIKKNMLHV